MTTAEKSRTYKLVSITLKQGLAITESCERSFNDDRCANCTHTGEHRKEEGEICKEIDEGTEGGEKGLREDGGGGEGTEGGWGRGRRD